MHIWVDADACPAVIKDILFKAARRTKLPLSLVANHSMSVPPDKHITLTQVPSGFDAADDYIVEKCEAGDLVITNDIPLAADVLAKNALALNNRGEEYDKSSIKQILGMRDFMETMRSSGMQIKSNNPSISQNELMTFANKLDTFLTKLGY